ncbi:MAG: anti-sigma factor family protein [Thermoguttaceae bacterium]
MSQDLSPIPPISRDSLDLLVDGELPEPQRRELLARLDQLPGGWRACAMAFLEAQCLREALSGVCEQRGTAPAVRPVSAARTRPRWLLRGFPTLLAVAATFLIALGLGWMLRQGPVGGSPGFETRQVAAAPEGPQEGQLAWQSPPHWGAVGVSLPGLGEEGSESVLLPIQPCDGMEQSWFEPPPEALPAELRAILSRLGCQVRQQRHLVPLPVEDGWRLVFPLDHFELRYVGDPAY